MGGRRTCVLGLFLFSLVFLILFSHDVSAIDCSFQFPYKQYADWPGFCDTNILCADQGLTEAGDYIGHCTCDGAARWNDYKCGGPLPPFGSISAPDCTTTGTAGSCGTTVTWSPTSGTHIIYTTLVNGVTGADLWSSSGSIDVGWITLYGVKFTLHDSSHNVLAEDTAYASCQSGYHQEGSVCVQDCVDECTTGTSECTGAFQGSPAYQIDYRTCGNFDADSCLEWGSSSTCSSGTSCSSGSCVACNYCTSSDELCWSGDAYNCNTALHCNAWASKDVCGAGESCVADGSVCADTCYGSSAVCCSSSYGSACSSAANACGQTSSGTVQCSGLCSGSTPAVPAEVCDGVDNDCDGFTDEGLLNVCGSCGSLPAGYGSSCNVNACGVAGGTIGCSGACSSSTPAVPAEVCDGVDNDCDGSTDEGGNSLCSAGFACVGSCQPITGSISSGSCQLPDGVGNVDTCPVTVSWSSSNAADVRVFTSTPSRWMIGSGGSALTGDWYTILGSSMTLRYGCLDDVYANCAGTLDSTPINPECKVGYHQEGSKCVPDCSPNQGNACNLNACGTPGGTFDCFDVCSGSAPAVPAETCDGVDNDCDGSTDEGCSWYCDDDDSDNRIGSSAYPFALAASGYEKLCTDISGCSVTPNIGTSPSCPIEGNSCDDDPDNTMTQSCGTNVGVCSVGIETNTCANNVWTGYSGCTAVTGTPESCNGLDDDCDGLIDENGCSCIDGFVDTQSCGSDVGVCTSGTQSNTCAGGVPGPWSSCTGSFGPFAEVCDGWDNDCDGATDEGVLNACGSCGSLPAGYGSSCNVNACGIAGGTIGCSGACSGSTPSLPAGYGGLCNLNACGTAGGTVQCSGLCSGSTPAVPAEVCDGVDNDCDGLFDEGGNGLCNDGNSCTDNVCGGLAGCSFPGVAADCTAGSCGALGTTVHGCYACTYGSSCPVNEYCTALTAAGTCEPILEICNNVVDDADANSWADEADPSCGISLSLTPDPVDQGASVLATWNADDGGLSSGTYRICGNLGCTATGTCTGGLINEHCSQAVSGSPASSSCLFDAPLAYNLKSYFVCFGGNAAEDTIYVNTECGNGFRDPAEPGEQCDDGNTANNDGCSSSCQWEVCGDNVTNNGTNETCDDGGTVDGDGCSALCQLEVCGDDIRNNGEDCDGPDLNGQTCKTQGFSLGGVLSCDSDCSFYIDDCAFCGDGFIEGDEVCDTANFGGATCNSLTGLPYGDLLCVDGCTRIDNSSCTSVPPVSPLTINLVDSSGAADTTFSGVRIKYSVSDFVSSEDVALTKTFSNVPIGDYLVSAQAGGAYGRVFHTHVMPGSSVNITLEEPYCAAGCSGLDDVCNFQCLGGSSCSFDTTTPVSDPSGLAYWANEINPSLNASDLAALAVAQCDSAGVGELRSVFGYPGFSFVCCGDASQSAPLVRDVFQEATVDADADNLIIFERVVRGQSGSPIVLNIVTVRGTTDTN